MVEPYTSMRWVSLLLLPLVLALSPSSVFISARVGLDGYADVREEYMFILQGQDVNEFLRKMELFGNNFELWKGNTEGLDTHLGEDATNVTMVTRFYEGTGMGKIILTYRARVAYLVGKRLDGELWLLSKFNFPRSGSLLEVPDGYVISIELPSSASVIEVKPEGSLQGGTITWEGPFTTLSMYVKYLLPTPIVIPSPLGISSVWHVVAAVLILLAIILWKFEGKVRELASKSVKFR